MIGMIAIIISGMPAVGKTTAAGIVAAKLGLKAVGGGDILKEMAAERGYKVGGDDWWDTADGIAFLRERESNPDFDKEADRKLIEKIERGNIVITSYTAPWLSKQGFKVWLESSVERRAERMAKRDKISIEESIRRIKVRDEENYQLYKKMYGIEFGKDKKPFDIVVNTENIEAEEVASIILAKIREL